MSCYIMFLKINVKRNDCEFPEEDRIAGNIKRQHRGEGRRTREDKDERGLGRAYIISDSTFERARRIPAILLSLAR